MYSDLAAYNAAFDKLGLDWRWTADDYRRLVAIADERARIGSYVLERHPNLLTAYDIGFLSELIHATKERYRRGSAARPAH